MGHGLAHQAHASEHQKHAEGSGAEGQGQTAGPGTLHDAKLKERAERHVGKRPFYGTRCEASISCIRCSSGLGLRDWKSPNTQSTQDPLAYGHP